MSLTYSITNAMSGLVATSRSAEVVSNNVANATTEGYARREIDLSARNVGGRGAGVSVDGVRRVVDEALLRDRRLADASVGDSSVKSEFYASLERLIGTPEDGGSLAPADFDLTRRERAVLELVAQGRSNVEIADELAIRSKTVRNHVSNICGKLAVSGRSGLVVEARNAGFGHD